MTHVDPSDLEYLLISSHFSDPIGPFLIYINLWLILIIQLNWDPLSMGFELDSRYGSSPLWVTVYMNMEATTTNTFEILLFNNLI